MVTVTYKPFVKWNVLDDDVSARLLDLSWRRGRDVASQLVGRSMPGILVMTLDNESGDYSPFNSASPLFGFLKPNRRVRLEVSGGLIAAGHVEWTGFIDSIHPIPGVDGRMNTVEIIAVGPLGQNDAAKVSLVMKSNVLTGTSVGDVLDEAGWPAVDRTVDAGQTTMKRFWSNEIFTRTALRKIEETEGGFIAESKSGKVVFEDRHHRLKADHLTSQATFSDAAAPAVGYRSIDQQDPRPFIFNKMMATVKLPVVGTLAVLWTLAESGASSPFIDAGQSRIWWASFPNPDSAVDAFAVDAWTTPVATTDFTANTAADGSGTNRTSSIAIAVSKFSHAMKITLTNNHGTDRVAITLLQARGVPLSWSDPVSVSAEDATSKTDYGERDYPHPGEFIPSTDEARDWADFTLSIYKDPIAMLRLSIVANKNNATFSEAMNREISDRVTVVAQNNAGLGINKDFFIEVISHRVVGTDRLHTTEFLLSDAEQFADFWVFDTAKFDQTTRFAY